MVRFGAFSADCQFLSGLFGVLYLELVDCAFRVAYISNATSVPMLLVWVFSGQH
jgi:hypothetical protein